MGTADGIGGHAVLASDLLTLGIDWRPGELPTAVMPARKQPRPASEAAVRAAVTGLAEQPRGQLHMACGWGEDARGLMDCRTHRQALNTF